MIAAFVLVGSLCLLVIAGALPPLVGELGYTLLMGATSAALLRLARRAEGLRWQHGIFALAGAALLTACANLAWVYGSVRGELPLVAEFAGATLWTLVTIPWAYALSLALFIVYRRLRGAVFIELIAQLAGLVAAVTFIASVVLGLVLGFDLGITVADNATTYFSAVLVVPAVALWFSRAEPRLRRPCLLLSFATIAWFLADTLYVRLPERYDVAMIFNALASLQWLLVFLAGVRYVTSGVEESARIAPSFRPSRESEQLTL